MPIANHTLTGDFSSLVGEISRLRATIRTNSDDGSWVNDTDNVIRLGDAQLSTSGDGKFTIALPTSIDTGLQYQVDAEYVDASLQRKRWSSGWFNLTGDADLAQKANDSNLRISSSLGEKLAARIDGYVNHGAVSGAVTFTGPTGSHWFSATGPTTVTLDGFEEGQIVSLLCFAGASDVAFVDAPALAVADGFVTAGMLAEGSWYSGGGGSGEPIVSDTTPPSTLTGLTATAGDDGDSVDLSWTAATDAESTVRYRFRIYPTGGAVPAWPTSGPLYGITGTSLTATGLDGGTAYTVEGHAYSSGGSGSSDSSTFTTPAPLLTVFTDTFTGPNGSIGAHTADTGQTYTGTTSGSQINANRAVLNDGWISAARSGGIARETTFDVTFSASGGTAQVLPWDTGAADAGVGFTINQNGQVSINGISAPATFNIEGTGYYFTSVGYLTLALNTPHNMKCTYDGTAAALYVNGAKIVEGTPATSMAGTHLGLRGNVNAYLDNVIVKAIA